jgi:hypothetical protein
MSEVNFDEKDKESPLPFLGTVDQMINKYDQVYQEFKDSLNSYVAKVLEDKPSSNKD